jgi:hypothetical protein
MHPAGKPNRQEYIECLRRLGPEGRINIMLELTETMYQMLREAIARRYPEMTAEERHQVFLDKIKKCRNRNY